MSLPPNSSAAKRAPRERRPVPRVITDAAPLVALFVLFISSDPRFTFTDDEAAMLNRAAQPLGSLLDAFRSAAGPHPHPPLYDLLLHFWMLVTRGSPELLRVPSMIFFIGGVWLLSRAALRIAGEQSGTSMIWLVALGPFGFHYARQLSVYSLSFFLIAALTWAYLRYASAPSAKEWTIVCALAILLVWTDYLAWIVLVFLAVEELLRNRHNLSAAAKRLAVAAAVLLVASIPLWQTFAAVARAGFAAHLPWRAGLINIGYNVYVLGVSESLAPWYWKYGVPGMIAVVTSLALLSVPIRGQARRFLIYGAALLILIALSSTLSAESLLIAAPWILLAAAAVIGTTHTSIWRRSMAVALSVMAAVGWYGVIARIYYATPRFVEPWGDLAVAGGSAIRDGGAVVANSPSFFLYLTYALHVPDANPWHFVGSLPTTVQYPQVWSPEAWQAAGQPLRPVVLFVAGMPETNSMDQAGVLLDHSCGDRTERRLARDPAFTFKQRFLHQQNATPWLIEFRQYECGTASSTATPAPPAQSPTK